jgi:hypothetical protein
MTRSRKVRSDTHIAVNGARVGGVGGVRRLVAWADYGKKGPTLAAAGGWGVTWCSRTAKWGCLSLMLDLPGCKWQEQEWG